MRRLSRVLLSALLLLLAASNTLRAISIAGWLSSDLVETAALLRYLFACSALWALGYAIACWGVARARPWAGHVTIGVAMTYQAHRWLNRLLLTRDTESMARLSLEATFSVAMTLALLALATLQRPQHVKRATNVVHNP
ncbi:MAG: hypothetical protein ACK4WM_11425 [Thermoflexales bacterium]